MDPEKALEELNEAVSTGDWDRASELADGLTGWFNAGGYIPQNKFEWVKLFNQVYGLCNRMSREDDSQTSEEGS